MQSTSLRRLKVRALIADGEYALSAGPHPERARRDSEALLLHIFQRENPALNLAWLLAHCNDPTSHGPEHRALVQRRLSGEPIQYIVGETEFYGLPFRVTPDVLIPRPETEHLVENVVALARPLNQPRIVDVGTGSGAIAITLALELPETLVAATDMSEAALSVAQENARHNCVVNRIRFLCGDLLTPVAGEQFDLIVSNPPYVPTADRGSLAVEVRDYEPALALFAGNDGLDIYRRLIPQGHSALASGGFIALEIGHGQAEAIRNLLSSAGFTQIEFTPDLQGIPRVATALRP